MLKTIRLLHLLASTFWPKKLRQLLYLSNSYKIRRSKSLPSDILTRTKLPSSRLSLVKLILLK